MTSGSTGHWTKMHQSLVKFSESEASNHMPSLADFTTTTPELKLSVHTRSDRSGLRCRLWMPERFPRASNPYRTIFERQPKSIGLDVPSERIRGSAEAELLNSRELRLFTKSR